MNPELLESLFGLKQQDEPKGLRGILQTTDYDTFIVLTDTGAPLHTFQGSKKANKCLPGDHVAWDNDQCNLELRDEHPLIVGTVELTNKSKSLECTIKSLKQQLKNAIFFQMEKNIYQIYPTIILIPLK